MKVETYLERIDFTGNITGSLEPTVETLRRLHRAHLLAIPFENLDIPLGKPISLSLPAIFEKVVTQGRGGFCYELNGLFDWLLRQVGFSVTKLAGQVYGENGLGPPFDHLLLLVEAEGEWIADVGFGDSFLEPLEFHSKSQGDPFFRLERGPLAACGESRSSARARNLGANLGQEPEANPRFVEDSWTPSRSQRTDRSQSNFHHRLLAADREVWTLLRQEPSREGVAEEEAPTQWKPQYVFTPQAHDLVGFEAMCHYQQTSPDSVFTRKSVCSRATHEGRVTLANGYLIQTRGESREKQRVRDEAEYRQLLWNHFAMKLPASASVDRLLGDRKS